MKCYGMSFLTFSLLALQSWAATPAVGLSDPWESRMPMERETTVKSAEDKSVERVVRQEVREICRILREILEEKKDGQNNARLDYLKSKLVSLDSFAFKVEEKELGFAAVSLLTRTIHLSRDMLQAEKKFQRYFVLAHEVGHLISVPAYLGVAGLMFLTYEALDDNLLEFKPSNQGKFTSYTLDNYPFIEDLKNYITALQTEYPGRFTGLEYVTANAHQRKSILAAVQQWKDEVLRTAIYDDEKGQEVKFQINDVIKEEYANFDVSRMNEALYLNNALQNNRLIRRMLLAQGKEQAKLATAAQMANSRIDEVLADFFARQAIEKKIRKMEKVDQKLGYARSGKDYFTWCQANEIAYYRNRYGIILRRGELRQQTYQAYYDAHLPWADRLKFYLSSKIIHDYANLRTRIP